MTPRTLLAVGLLCLAACGTDDPPAPPKVAVTGMGTPQGTPTQGLVTPAGGTLASADGKLVIDVPPGAVAADTTLTIQPITNEAPGGSGTAYRLGPEGQTFAVPATLTFVYDAADERGSDPATFGIAFQDAIGQWHPRDVVLDTTAHTLAVQTPHFSDWSKLRGYQIRPGAKNLKIAETLELSVEFCDSKPPAPDLEPLMFECSDELELLNEQKWLVNGTAVNPTFGSIQPTGNSTATYTAPSAAPPLNPIAVSTDFHGKNHQHILLVANITVGQPPLAGTIDATIDDGNGRRIASHATVSFVWNDMYESYTSTGGHVAYVLDQVTPDCTGHGIGETDIAPSDGFITFVSGTQYFFGGASSVTIDGTETCFGSTAPFTTTDVDHWFPSVEGTFSVLPDGTVSGNVSNAPFGGSTVTMSWSLTPQQN